MVGRLLDNKNAFFAKLFEQHYPSSFKNYTATANDMLFCVSLSRIETCEYENSKPYQVFCDFAKKIFMILGLYNKISISRV